MSHAAMFGAEAGPPNTAYTHVKPFPPETTIPGGSPGPTGGLVLPNPGDHVDGVAETPVAKKGAPAPGIPGGSPGPTQRPKPPIVSGGTRPPGPQRQPLNAKQQRRAPAPGGRTEY